MTPVAATVDDDGKVVVSTTGGSAKVRNLRRTPFASILVMNDGFFGAWCSVEGPVEIVELPAAMDGLVAVYYRNVGGEHPTGTTTAVPWRKRAGSCCGSPSSAPAPGGN